MDASSGRKHPSFEVQSTHTSQQEKALRQQREDVDQCQRQRSRATSVFSSAFETPTPLQGPSRTRHCNTPLPKQPPIAESDSMQLSLLLSRSIRDPSRHRVIGSISREANAHENDDTCAPGKESPGLDVPRHPTVEATVSPSYSLSTSSPSTPILVSPITTPTLQEMPMRFESLWSSIDRYLFAVYTTLQTGDESSLRPLRAPKHRMGWYTVIYNACSGDPTKSRQFYTRLALLLQRILESHVLFPILQNVDRSRVQFLTRTNDNMQTDSSENVQHRQKGRSSSLKEHNSGHSNGNSSFDFVKRLLHPLSSPTLTTAVAHTSLFGGGRNKGKDRKGKKMQLSQSPAMAAAPILVHCITDGSRQEGSSRAHCGVMSVSNSSSPPTSVPLHTVDIFDANSSSYNPHISGVSAAENVLQSAFTGFSTAVCTESSPITSPPQPSETQTYTPDTATSRLRHYSTRQGANAPAESGSSSCVEPSPSSGGRTAIPGTCSTASTHHARVASKTGRVLVDDEEEVLCDTNTVAPAARHSPQRLQLWANSSSGGDSTAAPASLTDIMEGKPEVLASENDDEDSLHTMNSSLSYDILASNRRHTTEIQIDKCDSFATPHRSRCESQAARAEFESPLSMGTTATLAQPARSEIPLPLSPKETTRTYCESSRVSTHGSSTSPERVVCNILGTAATAGVGEASRSSPESRAATSTSAVHAAGAAQRSFSLCYTFLQEWQTFLVFRRVVLSCFRYLDQYYTRRFGMDTITLMCFKLFYVIVYEPLRPLLSMELRHLVQYVREIFETTGQVAWEQLELIQDTYSMITELLFLVQSTSSSMVAQQQQQQQQQQAGSGVGGGGGTAAAMGENVSSAVTAGGAHISITAPRFMNSSSSGAARSQVAPPATTPTAVVEGLRQSPARNHDGDITGARHGSAVSSVVTTPHLTPLDPRNSGGTAASVEGERCAAPAHVSRRRRLLSLFTAVRLGDNVSGGSNSDRDPRSGVWAATSIPASPVSIASSFPGPHSAFETESFGCSAKEELGGAGIARQDSAAKGDLIPEPAVVVVDLRGTVELRDRLEGHTPTHHLTTQALKQWEGMAADRRPRHGTIVKVIAKPLATIVMEDVGNDYVAGICTFYRCAREVHRSTDEGRRGYVDWALGVKELERHVWQRVQLPFLHASLRSALNEVLVVEPHRSLLLDPLFGLRALLDKWSAEAADSSLAPQTRSGVSKRGGSEAQECSSSSTATASAHRLTSSMTTFTSLGGGLGKADRLVSSGAQCGGNLCLEPPMSGSLQRSHQCHVSSFPHQRTASPLPLNVDEKQEAASQPSFSLASPHEEGGVVGGVRWTTAARTHDRKDTATVAFAVHCGSHGSGERQPATGTAQSALVALESLYRLFSDVSEDECFVLMAAIIITKLHHDAAGIIERYLDTVASVSSSAPSPAHLQPHGTQMMASLVELVTHYMDLAEVVFRNNPTVLSALSDAIEELVCPFRWTRKGALQASQQRAHDALRTALAATTARTSGGSVSETAFGAAAGLPSVLLSRDARQATVPLVALAAKFPEAVQQLKPSALLAHYADAFLREECGGGRVLSGNLNKRLRLIARLVALLEDKDVFLENYRLCLARRLLGYSNSAMPPQPGVLSGTAPVSVNSGVRQPSTVGRVAQGSCVSAALNVEAERQLVSFLQSYLGVTSTRAFEAMIRDYEGTERTRDLFEQEPAYQDLPAKIQVQLITSAHWPTYAMPPLQPHAALQRGMEVFRAHYARQHPSRTLFWVFSLGSATLTAELVSGTKQVVASTILATLLLVVSDAYNAASTAATHPGVLTGTKLAQILGLPFHDLRPHLHLLTQHRAFNLLRWTPLNGNSGTGVPVAAASIMEKDSFSLNPLYTHKLRKVRLPLPKARLTGLPSSDANAIDGEPELRSRPYVHADSSSLTSSTSAAPVTAAAEDAILTRHVQATRRVLLDAAIVRIFKSRRVMVFEDLVQVVTAHLSRQFFPSRRDIKTQLEGLIDRDYVRRSPSDPNAFVYIS